MRLVARLAPLVYRAWMGLVAATSRADESCARELDARRRRGERIVLLMLHQDVFAAPWFLRGLEVCGLASTGDAGDIIDAVMVSLGHSNVRGGTSGRESRRRTLGALRAMIRHGRERADRGFVIAITPDGSIGPAGACKPGFGLVALETGASVWCIKIHASPALLLKTWDRTMLPLPFGRVWARMEGPFDVPADADAAALEHLRLAAESSLHRLHARVFDEGRQAPVPPLAFHSSTSR
ncbi:MAG: lysophospholipid acyltransferase family protein [Candidatus Binatia bacterium]